MSICATRLVFSRADQGLATSKSPCAASQTHPPPGWVNTFSLGKTPLPYIPPFSPP